MNLEDGRVLIPSKRYSQLPSRVAHNTLQQTDLLLTPIHEKFRVIALGVPVPPYLQYCVQYLGVQWNILQQI